MQFLDNFGTIQNNKLDNRSSKPVQNSASTLDTDKHKLSKQLIKESNATVNQCYFIYLFINTLLQANSLALYMSEIGTEKE